MTGATEARLRNRRRLLMAGAVLGLGLALMTMMIVVEGEPGLLPLLLVLGGGLGFVGAWRRRRRARGDMR